MIAQAVILAGGKGTRLSAHLRGLPKCLVEVDGVPLLERQIMLLKKYHVREVVILINHAADQIASFLESRGHFGIRITLLDDGVPRGTAGAVLAALPSLQDRFIVLYGDTLLNIDLDRFTSAHDGADVTLFLHPNDHPADSDLIDLDDEGWVRALHPYPHDPNEYYANLVNAALYVVERSALEPWSKSSGPLDFGKDLFPAMLAAGARLKGYRSFEYIKDIGTPSRLAKAERHLRSGLVERASLATKQKAVFVDRDGTLNVHRGFIRNADAIEMVPGAAEAIKRLNDGEYRVVIVTNQPVIARGEATYSDLRRMHAKIDTELGRHGAYIDALYMCPHHPDRGFPGEVKALKIECDCRKPKMGMLLLAMTDLNLDPARSWMIGDTTSDLEMAHRANIRSILVRTGEGGKDRKFDAKPGFVADDLSGAVDLLLSREQAV